MDVKLSSSSPSLTSDKQFDFCDDLSEHGYGSLEDLHCPTSNGSPIVQGCDVSSSSSLPTTITTTTITSSSSSLSPSSPPLSSSSSIDAIASLNNSSSPKSTETCEPASISHGNNCNTSQTTGDQDSDKKLISSPVLDNSDNSLKESNHRCKETSSGESKNDEKINNDDKVHSPSPQMVQSGNRFRFVPKNRQANDTKCKGTGTCPTNNRNSNYRGSRKHSRSESDCMNREHENRKRSQMRNKSNEDIVFIIRRVDRSLRRTVSESSGETLPVRGILKYPRDWNRRTLSESNCDNSDQSNLIDSHENGQTQSLECISPLEASCEVSTESACSSAGESPVHDEEKPKKSVHFNCYVSKATFNINSTILNNNKHSGSNKKKNRRQNSNNPSSNHNHNNDHKNNSISISTTTTTTTTTITTNNNNATKKNTNHKSHKDSNPNKHQNNTSRWKSQQSHQQNHHLEANNNQRKIDPTKPSTDQQSVDYDENESIVISNGGDKVDQCENIDPMETKMRSRQDSGYDSETSERKGFVEDSGTTTCVKSPNRQFTIKKVDLN